MVMLGLLTLTLTASALLLFSNQLERQPATAGWIALGSSLFAFLFFANSGFTSDGTVLGMISANGVTAIGAATLCLIAGLTIMGMLANPHKYTAGLVEVYSLVLYTALGGILILGANNLLLLYVGIELSSYSTYVLVGYFRNRRKSTEAAGKYFVLGALASAFLLYGFSLVFAASGSIYFDAITANLLSTGGNLPTLIYPALALLLVGFGFKLALVPFHAWTPDAYQGAPTMVAALLSVGPKVAITIALAHLVTKVFNLDGLELVLTHAFAYLAALTMTIGNLQALGQNNLKRLLGYSSIAQLGTITVGIASGSIQGYAAIMLYGIGYVFSNIGAFTVIATLADNGIAPIIDKYKGLGKRQPVIAILFTLFLLSLAGMPLLAGFVGKLFVFKSAVDAGLILLALIAVANTVLAYFYYFRVIIAMWLHESDDSEVSSEASGGLQPIMGVGTIRLQPSVLVALIVSAIGILLIGILPSPLLNSIYQALQ